jgi:RNA polymerase sigma factor (sigma-70 family)
MEARSIASDTARELFQAHGAVVYRFLAVLLRHHQDAEDCVQETFLKLLRHLDAGGETSNVRGWLFTVAAHAARDRQRRQSRWIPFLPAHAAQVPPAQLPDEDGRLKSARDALRQLTARDRLLLALRAQGLSYRDIAAAARIRPASVGRLLARAVDRWATNLRKDGNAYDVLERHSNPGAR